MGAVLGLTGLICISAVEFSEVQKKYQEVPTWSYTLPNRAVVQVWENRDTGTSTIVYLNRLGRICIMDAGTKNQKKPEERDG